MQAVGFESGTVCFGHVLNKALLLVNRVELTEAHKGIRWVPRGSLL